MGGLLKKEAPHNKFESFCVSGSTYSEAYIFRSCAAFTGKNAFFRNRSWKVIFHWATSMEITCG